MIVIDMFSDYSSSEVKPLLKDALRAAPKIAALKRRCVRRGIPVIYVNDNHGEWRSTADDVVNQTRMWTPSRLIAEQLSPTQDDYFLLKPKHSIFMATPLDVLLAYMRTDTLILTGTAGIQCVLASAMEAHIRDLRLIAPRDCIVSRKAKDAVITQYILRTHLKADTRASNHARLTRRTRPT